jgi:hypothetical protein
LSSQNPADLLQILRVGVPLFHAAGEFGALAVERAAGHLQQSGNLDSGPLARHGPRDMPAWLLCAPMEDLARYLELGSVRANYERQLTRGAPKRSVNYVINPASRAASPALAHASGWVSETPRFNTLRALRISSQYQQPLPLGIIRNSMSVGCLFMTHLLVPAFAAG